MSDTVATGTYRGRLGSYSMTVTGPTGALTALGKVVATDLSFLEVPQITHGTMQPGFGGGILPLEMVLRLVDSGNLIQRLRALYPAERDVVLSISGADGRGNTGYWSGTITRATPAQSLSPRVYPLKTIEVEVRCGLAGTPEVTAPTASGIPWGLALHRALGNTYQAQLDGYDQGTFIYPALRPSAPVPDGGDPYGAERVRFTGAVTGSGTLGDTGDAADVIEAMARTFTLTLFHPVLRPALGNVAASGEDRVHALPRSRVGTAITGRGYYSDVLTDSATLAADTLELGAEDWEAEPEGNDRLPSLGSISFTPTPGASGGVANASAIIGVDLEDTELVSEPLLEVGPASGLQIHVTASSDAVADPPSVPPADAAIHHFFIVDSAGDNQYYDPGGGGSWSTTPYDYDTLIVDEDIPLDSAPEGTLYVRVTGNAAGYTVTPEYATATIEDATSGDVITGFIAREGDATYGEVSADCPLMPDAEVVESSSWAAVTEWESDVTGETYVLLQSATAAERFAQQGQRLRVLTLTIIGALVGPGTRLRFKPTSEDSASPFSTEVYAVIVGASPDLSTGNTRAVVVDAAEDGLT